MRNFFFDLVPRFIVCGLLSWIAVRLFSAADPRTGAIGLAIVAPAWGFLFARPVLDFVLSIRHRGEHDALIRWHGRYYSFDGQQLRFYWLDDVVWVPQKDVGKLLSPAWSERELRLLGEHYAQIPGTKEMGFSETGLRKLLLARTEHRRADYQMIRFKRWLETEAFPNVKRLPSSSLSSAQK
ncbi:MAG: hypothetical protein KGM99_04575 [Burkholderiales bacterium]|nr:hypothetical protein [Burkholderiales bacterium]